MKKKFNFFPVPKSQTQMGSRIVKTRVKNAHAWAPLTSRGFPWSILHRLRRHTVNMWIKPYCTVLHTLYSPLFFCVD